MRRRPLQGRVIKSAEQIEREKEASKAAAIYKIEEVTEAIFAHMMAAEIAGCIATETTCHDWDIDEWRKHLGNVARIKAMASRAVAPYFLEANGYLDVPGPEDDR